jgi:hypothetical protein
MKEPRRLLDDSSSALERALLDAGVSYRCSADTRVKTMAALGLAGSAALTASTLGVASTSWFAKIGWLKLLLGVSAVGAVSAVPLGYRAWQRHHPQPIVNEVSQVGAGLKGSEPVAQVKAVADSDSLRQEIAPISESSEGVSNSKASASSKADAPVPGLAEELAALDAARSLLTRGDSTAALVRLDAYNRTYPKGRLRLEAEVLRIDALNKNGQSVLAKKRAEAFLLKYPNSVLASRVRTLLGP